MPDIHNMEEFMEYVDSKQDERNEQFGGAQEFAQDAIGIGGDLLGEWAHNFMHSMEQTFLAHGDPPGPKLMHDSHWSGFVLCFITGYQFAQDQARELREQIGGAFESESDASPTWPRSWGSR